MSADTLAIFVGGRSRRMGGRPKGLLRVDGAGPTLVERLAAEGRAVGLLPVLVGDIAAYDGVLPEVDRLTDRPAGVGPLGGFGGLFARDATAIAVGCDMPNVTRTILERLASHASPAAALVPRTADGHYEPLLARYRCAPMRVHLATVLSAGRRSLRALIEAAGAAGDLESLPLDDALRAAAIDWDTPSDVR